MLHNSNTIHNTLWLRAYLVVTIRYYLNVCNRVSRYWKLLWQHFFFIYICLRAIYTLILPLVRAYVWHCLHSSLFFRLKNTFLSVFPRELSRRGCFYSFGFATSPSCCIRKILLLNWIAFIWSAEKKTFHFLIHITYQCLSIYNFNHFFLTNCGWLCGKPPQDCLKWIFYMRL